MVGQNVFFPNNNGAKTGLLLFIMTGTYLATFHCNRNLQSQGTGTNAAGFECLLSLTLIPDLTLISYIQSAVKDSRKWRNLYTTPESISSIFDRVKSIATVYGRDWCNLLFLASIDFKIIYAALWVMTYFVLYIPVPFPLVNV